MASDVRINDGSVGFINPNGQVKSKKEDDQALQKIEASGTLQNTSENPTTSLPTEDRSTVRAVGIVRERFSTQTNDVITGLNGDREKLQQARSVIKEQISVAKDLKEALKDGDEKKAEKLAIKFKELEETRSGLADDVKVYNDQRVTTRAQSINLGNEQKGIVRTEEIRLEKSSKVDLTTAKSINNFLGSAKEDLASVKQQLQTVNDKRDEVKGIVSQTRDQLNQVEQGSIKNIAQAEEAVKQIATQIKGAGIQSFEQATLSKINEDVSARILSQLRS